MSLIPITGIASTFRVPGAFAEIVFAQGPSSAGAGVRSACLVMPMSASGTWTVNTRYQVRNEGEARVGAGAGSPLHRACRAFLAANKSTPLFVVPYAASSGAGVASATSTITIATAPTGSGLLYTWVAGEPFTVAFTTSDTVSTIATNLANQINARDWLPVTASPAAGVVTLTAKIAGASQGTGSATVIRVRVAIDPGKGTTVTSTGSLGSVTAGADGATTEAANLAAALATLSAVRHYYMAVSVNDTTGLASLSTHIATKSLPISGLRSIGFYGFVGSASLASASAVARNYERLTCVWQRNSEHDLAELAASVCAVRALEEADDTAFNFDNYRTQFWQVKPAYAVVDWPTPQEQSDAINDGITVIASDNAGSYIVTSVNTRSKNAAGAVNDFRACETHRVSVADEFTDELLAIYGAQYSGLKLRDDVLLPNGQPDPNQTVPRGVMVPSRFKPFIRDTLVQYSNAGKLQNVDASIASLNVLRSPDNSGRLECGLDLNVIDLLHQATFRVAEVSRG